MYSVQLWKTNVFSTTVDDECSQYNCGRQRYSVQLWKTNVFSTNLEDIVHSLVFFSRNCRNVSLGTVSEFF